MSVTPHLSSASAEQFRLQLGRLWSYFTLTNGNTVDASVVATSVNPAFKIFTEAGTDSGAPDTVDSGNGFTTLDTDADPAIVGFLGMVGDALEFYGPGPQFYEHSGDITAVTWTLEGTGTTGITASKNLAFTGSFAGVDLDAANTNVHKFSLEVFYRKG
jgi:hypothetical protein